MAISSRLVIPVCDSAQYQFSDLSKDPYELDVIESWDKGEKLWRLVEERFGSKAREWVEGAEKVVGWDDGTYTKDHWWNT